MSANVLTNPDHDQELNDDIYLTPNQLLWVDAIIEAVDEYIVENGDKYEAAKKLIFGKFDGFSIFDHVFDHIFCNERYRYISPEDARIALEKRRISYQRKKRKMRLKRIKEIKQDEAKRKSKGFSSEEQTNQTNQIEGNPNGNIKKGSQDVKNQDCNGRGNGNSVIDDNDRDTRNLENDETEPGIEFILFGASN